MPATSRDPAELLEPLRADPGASAVLTDVDGTLSPIAARPEEAVVLPDAREALASLVERFALVGCVSGRRAVEVRELVGLGQLTYLGNHGLERLEPGAAEPLLSPALADHAEDVAGFVRGLDRERLSGAGLRLEDKGPIAALHWRSAADEERAERLTLEIGAEAESAGLALHRGRKVLELRPAVAFDKGTAIAELLAGHPVRHALYAGDDRTDLDGFRRLRELVAAGELETACCVAIASPESPPEVAAEADAVVAEPAGFAKLLRGLAG